jgi:hypothetical protein
MKFFCRWLVTSLLCLLAYEVTATSPPQWIWAKPLPESALATDPARNVFLAGQFTGTLALGTTNLTATGVGDVFLIKADPAGTVLWARQASGDAKPLDVTIDSAGNIFAAGYFQDVLNFGTTNVDSGYFTWMAGFVARYDSNGNILWVRTSGAFESGHTLCHGIAVDQNTNVIAAGHMRPVISFGGTQFDGYDDAFLVKFNRSGTVLWRQKIGGIYTNTWNWHVASDVALDAAGNIHITGAFSHNARFGAVELASGGNTDIFVAKYSSAGALIWVRQAGSAIDERDEDAPLDIGRSIAVDSDGGVYVTGSFDYPGATFGTTNLASAGLEGGEFLAKYDANGTLLWVKQGDSSAQVGWRVQLDRGGDVYAVARELSPTFASKWDPHGNLHWAQGSSPASVGLVSSCTVGTDGYEYISGTYPRLAEFGNTSLTNRFGTFVAKLDRNFPRLNIKPASNTIVLSWPAGATEFELQQALGLVPSAWQPAGATSIVNGSVRTTTVGRTNASQFFRLKSLTP